MDYIMIFQPWVLGRLHRYLMHNANLMLQTLSLFFQFHIHLLFLQLYFVLSIYYATQNKVLKLVSKYNVYLSLKYPFWALF